MEWINVEDKLPNVGENILATAPMPDGTQWFGCCVYPGFFPWVLSGKTDDPITHWMPLPNPPEDK